MELLTFLAALLFLCVVYYAVAPPSPFAAIPGPSLRSYLPGGLMHRMWADPSTMLEVVTALARAHGPVYQVWLGPTRMLVVTDAADVAHVVSNADDFDRPSSMAASFDSAMPRSIFTMPRHEHRAARRTLRANFNHALLPHFHASLGRAAQEIVAELRAAAVTPAAAEPQPRAADEKRAHVDINGVFATVATRVILNVALGGDMDMAQRKAFAQCLDTLFAEMLEELTQYPVRQILAPFGTRRRLFAARARVEAVSRRLLEQRTAEDEAARARRAPDLLDAILALEGHDAARRVAEVTAFFIAGAHTVSMGLSWALYHVAQRPRIQAKLHAEVDAATAGAGADAPLSPAQAERLTYVRQVWKETLRLTPPAAAVIRRASRDVVLKGSGTRVPRGTQVDALFSFTHKSERYYDDALNFVPERWGAHGHRGEADDAPAGAFLPYGAGQRSCAGQFLADYEGPVVLAEVLRHFRFELACPPEEIKSSTGLVEVPRWVGSAGGVQSGVPLYVYRR